MNETLCIKVLQSPQEKAMLEQHREALNEKIPYFSHELLHDRLFIAAMKEEQVVGLVSIVENSMRIPGAFGVGFVSVHENFRNQGVATSLVQSLFELANERRKPIANTHYEPDGLKWLKPIMTRTASDYPEVKLYER